MMIFSLQGIVQELTPTYVVINVNGVGYYVGISLMTSQTLALNQENHAIHPTNYTRRRTFTFWFLRLVQKKKCLIS